MAAVLMAIARLMTWIELGARGRRTRGEELDARRERSCMPRARPAPASRWSGWIDGGNVARHTRHRLNSTNILREASHRSARSHAQRSNGKQGDETRLRACRTITEAR